ncbi:MAG TPA: hypothetical protein VFK18_05035 [Luteimonas sp.]|nr:hypothetical protein [Luteimonas sp.]
MKFSPRVLFLAGCLLLVAALVLPHYVGLSDTVRGLLYGLAFGALFASLLRRWLPEPCDSAPPALRRRYLREFLPPMLGYMIALVISLTLLKTVEAEWLRALVALLPLPPIGFAVRAIVRYIRDTDELQRQIELEAVSIATALVSMLYLAGGFLQAAKVIDIPSSAAMIWVFPLICGVYGLAKVLVARRFR